MSSDKVRSHRKSLTEERAKEQEKIFVQWANRFLSSRQMKIENFPEDLKTGVLLINLAEMIAQKPLGRYSKKPRNKVQMIENITKALNALSKHMGLRFTCASSDIYEGRLTMILGFMWMLVRNFHVRQKGELLKTIADMTKGSTFIEKPPVSFTDTQWKTGNPVLAILQSRAPESLDSTVDWPRLSSEDRIKEGFEIARDLFGVESAIDIEEMASGSVDEIYLMSFISELLIADKKNIKLDRGKKTVVIDHTDELDALAREKLELEKASLSQEEELHQLRKLRQSLEEKLAEEKSVHEKTREKLKLAQKNLDKTGEEADKLKSDVTEMNEKFEEAQDEYKKLTKEIQILSLQMESGKSALSNGGVEAPQGDVTLCFTDIEGSTVQWETYPEAMAAALSIHNKIIRRNMPKYGGYEVKTEGDAFMIAFSDAKQGVKFCLLIQDLLLKQDWPAQLLKHKASTPVKLDGALIWNGYKVRMGLHRGNPSAEPDPVTGRMDYFGQMVNRSARVESVAHGGQIVVSESVWETIKDDLEELGSPNHKALGEFQLKGLKKKDKLWELVPKHLGGRKFAETKGHGAPQKTGLESELALLQKRNESLINEIAEMEDRARTASRKALSLTRGDAASIDATPEMLLEALNELNDVHKTQERQMAELLDQNKRAMSDTETAEAALAKLEKKLSASQKENIVMRSQASSKDIEEIKAQMQKEFDKENAKLKETLTRGTEEAAYLLSQFKKLKSELTDARSENQKMVKDIHKLTLQLPLYLRAGNATTKPPTGTVTLVFTDIQGSTIQWESIPDAMADALTKHNDLIRKQIDAYRGYEVKTEGDAFMIAFASTSDALAFCTSTQEALLSENWARDILKHKASRPEKVGGKKVWNGLRVRMGIHKGKPSAKPDPITGRMDYFGPMVNRAARVESVAHGGQIILSESAWGDVESKLSSLGNPSSKFLGEFQLKGLKEKDKLWQIVPQKLKGRTFAPTTGHGEEKTSGVQAELEALKRKNEKMLEHMKEMEAKATAASERASELTKRFSSASMSKVSPEEIMSALNDVNGVLMEQKAKMGELASANSRAMEEVEKLRLKWKGEQQMREKALKELASRANKDEVDKLKADLAKLHKEVEGANDANTAVLDFFFYSKKKSWLPVKQLTLTQLSLEKSELKKEIFQLNSKWAKLFNRKPSTKDKLPLRAVYHRYNELKAMRDKMIAQAASRKRMSTVRLKKGQLMKEISD